MKKRKIIAIIIETVIVIWTIIAVVGMLTIDPEDDLFPELISFCFFTTDSNILSGIASLVMLISLVRNRPSRAVSIFKFVGTAAVTVTFVTVMVFLAPYAGYGKMLEGPNFYMHLMGPVLALIACFLPEDGFAFSFKECLFGILPVPVYGAFYCYKVLINKTWPDFYGFTRVADWWVSFLVMLAGTFLICVIMRAVKNLRVKRLGGE